MIIAKGKDEPLFCDDSNDHQPIIEKFKLRDDKLFNRDFVRIELLPLGSLTSVKKADWEIRVDETGTLPSWFDLEKLSDKCKTLMVLQIIPEWIKNGVGGSLYLQDTQIKDLGKLESVGGSLYLQGTQIKDLGNLKSVGGYLNLQDTRIKDLPKGLKVKGGIYR